MGMGPSCIKVKLCEKQKLINSLGTKLTFPNVDYRRQTCLTAPFVELISK